MKKLMIALPIGIVLLTSGLFAQSPQQGVEGRGIAEADSRCQTAAAVIQARAAEPAVRQALGEGIRRCNRSGVEALSRIWGDPPAQGPMLGGLVARTQELHDQRILDPVLRIAEDEARSQDHRFAAMSVLMTYLMPLRRPPANGWYGGEHWRDEPTMSGSRAHAFWMEGEQPIDRQEKARIVQELERIQNTTNDIRIRNVARAIVLSYEVANPDPARSDHGTIPM